MALDRKDVANIAHLARLQINEDALDQTAQDLSNILDFAAKMNEVNTDHITPMAHPQDATQRLRPDEVTESNQRDEYQKIAPATEDGLFLVPKVIE